MEPTVKNPLEILKAGVQILKSLMSEHRFSDALTAAGRGSGGAYASAEFLRGDRRLEVHFRYSLGLVTYHVGNLSLSHEDYMWSVMGKRGASHYPGFSNDPLDGFRDLRRDLEEYGAAFLTGPDSDFLKCAKDAASLKVSGPRLPG
jgi:hypothetical protein